MDRDRSSGSINNTITNNNSSSSSSTITTNNNTSNSVSSITAMSHGVTRGGQAQPQAQVQPGQWQNNPDRWYFTREQMQNSPSRKCGVDADKELAYRQHTANLIQDMGQRLSVSQLCINTAIVYMHRFYAFHSFTHFHRNSMATAALFLAAKVEEQPRKLEYVIRVAHMCLHRSGENQQLDVRSDQYQEQAQDLVFNENVLLQTLGFDVAIDHPHTYILQTCYLVKASKELAQTSYFMASNSLHLTTMCLQYRPTVVACFCIHLASKWSNWAIPQSNQGKHWFYYVDKSVTQELLEQLTKEFLHIFDRYPSRLKKKIMSINNQGNNNSPQQANSLPHGMSSSPFDKECRKMTDEEMRKNEADKRHLFAPSGTTPMSSTPSASSVPTAMAVPPPTVNKMDYREYRERQQQQQHQQQQDRRRTMPPNMPPRHDMSSASSHKLNQNNLPPPPSSSHQQHRVPGAAAASSSSQQHNRWPQNQRPKEPSLPRPHTSSSSTSSSSSSRPPYRSSLPPQPQHQNASNVPPQQPPVPEQKPPRLEQKQMPLVSMQQHQNSGPPQQVRSHQPPLLSSSSSHPPHNNTRPPSLFSPEPQKRPKPLKHMAEDIMIPAPLSPFSSPPSSASVSIPPLELAPVKKEEPVTHHPPPEPPAQMQPPPSLMTSIVNNVETDPHLVSTLLKESIPHKSKKEKKKSKHKHKEKDKTREERKKHKKDKDRKRDSEHPSLSIPTSESSTPLKITIPKEIISTNSNNLNNNLNSGNHSNDSTRLTIKIPKDRLKAEPPAPPPGSGLKIKISKEMMGDSARKRPPSNSMMEGSVPPMKIARPHGHHHGQPSHPHQQQQQQLKIVSMSNGQSGHYSKKDSYR